LGTSSSIQADENPIQTIEIVGQRYCDRWPQALDCGGSGIYEPGAALEADRARNSTAESLAFLIERLISGYSPPCVKANESQAQYIARATQHCVNEVKSRVGGLWYFGVVQQAALMACQTQTANFVDKYINRDSPGNTC
jgi:D-serine deaminase-like pyridoxal phosphate-dependent protein